MSDETQEQLDELVTTTLEKAKQQLADAIRVQYFPKGLDWTPKPLRFRDRLLSRWRRYRPTMHLGPCYHGDCY